MRGTLHRTWPSLLIAIAAAAAFLTAGWRVMPMDDAYIHSVYARNLAEQGVLSFNLDPPDDGLGTTSILWPLLLAALHPLVGVINAARLLGLAAYLAVALAATVIASWMVPRDEPAAAWLTAALVALSGNLVWFALSGMETMLWLALGLGASIAYRQRRFVAVGILLGLMMLTRIEGVLLLGCIALVEVQRQRRVGRECVLMIALALVLVAPWLGYVHARTGAWLPTSYEGKKHAQVRGAVEIVKETLGARGDTTRLETDDLPWWVHLLYPLGVLAYGVSFVVGAAYLPGPRLPVPGRLGEVIGGLSVTGLVLLTVLFLPTILRSLRQASGVARGAIDDRRRVLLVLAGWFLLHNLAYWVKLPTPGTASRYQVVNHVAFWLLAGAGAWRLERLGARRRWVVAALLACAMANAAYWRGVYASDIRHMAQVRLAAADYIREDLPPEAVVAAHDIGALGWRMARRCLDLGGLIDPTYLTCARDGRVAEFLRERGCTYLVLPTKHSGEAVGFYDYADFVGLKDNPAVSYTPVRHFENDYDDWARGAAPTWNALPGVTVYRLEWEGAP